MKFRPLHGRVLIKPHPCRGEDFERHHSSHTDTAKGKPLQGEIVAVGPSGRDANGKPIPSELKVGDTVLFGKWSGTEVRIDGQDLLIVKESDIMSAIERGAAAKKVA